MLEMMTASFLKKLSAPGNEPGLEINPEVFQKLMASDRAPKDQFGISVATSADGMTVVIGAIGDGAKGFMSGTVYIFTKQANGSYLETQKLVATDGAAYIRFGTSIAVSNTSVVVGTSDNYSTDVVYIY